MAYAANRSDLDELNRSLGYNRGILNSQAETLNSIVGQANVLAAATGASTTVAEFNTSKAAYDVVMGKYATALGAYENTQVSYNAQTTTFNSLTKQYESMMLSRKVTSALIKAPNYKDRNQWMPGGGLKNDTGPGGTLWAPDRKLSLEGKSTPGTFNNILLSGGMLGFLNAGFSKVQSLASGGLLFDLISDFDTRSTAIFTYKMYLHSTGKDGHRVKTIVKEGTAYHTPSEGSDSDNSDGGGSDFTFASGPMDLDAAKAAFDARFDMRSMDPLSFSLEVIGLAWSGELSAENIGALAKGGLIGTAQNMVTEALTKAAIGVLGVSSLPVAIGIYMVTRALIGELMEMAAGLDNHFGPGGEYQGSINGEAHFTSAQSWKDYLKDAIMEVVTMGEHVSQSEREAMSFKMDKANSTASRVGGYGSPWSGFDDAYGGVGSIDQAQKTTFDHMMENLEANVANITPSVQVDTKFSSSYFADRLGEVTESDARAQQRADRIAESNFEYDGNSNGDNEAGSGEGAMGNDEDRGGDGGGGYDGNDGWGE